MVIIDDNLSITPWLISVVDMATLVLNVSLSRVYNVTKQARQFCDSQFYQLEPYCSKI